MTPGTRLGVYEVVASLGAGGMGEVYRARTKLNRDVALKVLPEAFASDPQRMGRFEREAQVLASLNHPNIAALYGLEESGVVRALVVELVEGRVLAERVMGAPRGAGLPHPPARAPQGVPLQLPRRAAQHFARSNKRPERRATGFGRPSTARTSERTSCSCWRRRSRRDC
jgi:serine/threonine protein kinase